MEDKRCRRADGLVCNYMLVWSTIFPFFLFLFLFFFPFPSLDIFTCPISCIFDMVMKAALNTCNSSLNA